MSKRLHKDIVNIVRKMLVYERMKKCNRKYHEYFQFDNRHNYLSYKNNKHVISFRGIKCYRREIVCFLTDRTTMYDVPENY